MVEGALFSEWNKVTQRDGDMKERACVFYMPFFPPLSAYSVRRLSSR